MGPDIINDLIEKKKKTLKILKAKHPIPRNKPQKSFIHFKPSFKDSFRHEDEYKNSIYKEVNVETKSEEKFKVPSETTPIDVAVPPERLFLQTKETIPDDDAVSAK